MDVAKIRTVKQQKLLRRLGKISYVRMILWHLAIAFVININDSFSFLYFIAVFGYLLFITIKNDNRNNEALMAAAYIAGAEVYWRMTDALIFYETGKYAVILFLLIGMIYKGTSSRTVPFWVYLLILSPGIVIGAMRISFDSDFRELVAFNLSGPVCLGICALYCYYKKITRSQMEKVLIFLLLPLLSQMFYLYFYTPTLREEIINIAGNYAATGGYGPNQISTVFGLGAVILAMRIFTIKSKLINTIDLILLGLMSYRAVITFSRGGVLTAIICIIAFLIIFYYKQNPRERSRARQKLGLLVVSVIFVWMYSMAATYGLIGNRYANENRKGEDKGDITTGRIELVETELIGFYHHPVLGIGVGNGIEFREKKLGIIISSHNEVSRLLAEHGLLGLVAILILIFVPLVFWLKFKNNYYFLAFMAFWFLTINHSAMRIALPAFIYGLALLYIVDEKENTLYR